MVLSGALPPGLSLNGSTTGTTYIEGTPTTAGTYNFTLQSTDTLSRVASVSPDDDRQCPNRLRAPG